MEKLNNQLKRNAWKKSILLKRKSVMNLTKEKAVKVAKVVKVATVAKVVRVVKITRVPTGKLNVMKTKLLLLLTWVNGNLN